MSNSTPISKRSCAGTPIRFAFSPENGSSWDRALFLNLTFWGASEGGDVLVDETVPADVVAHVAWHRLAAKALATPSGERPSVEALFLGEAIASAFDLYLVGRLLGFAPESSFLETQVASMAEAAESAGLEPRGFDELLQEVQTIPSRHSRAFAGCSSMRPRRSSRAEMQKPRSKCSAVSKSTRFAPLLHRYELSNWVLYARAYGSREPAPRVQAVDCALREARDPLAWLTGEWIHPAQAVATPASRSNTLNSAARGPRLL